MISKTQIQTIGCSIKARPLTADKLCSIHLLVIIDRKSDRIPLHIQWPLAKFDATIGKLLPRHHNDKECTEHNLIIDRFLALASNLRLQYYAYGKPVTLKEFRHNFINYSSRDNIIDYMSLKIDDLASKGIISAHTKNINKTSVHTLIAFKPKEYWTFDSITAEDLKAYQNWMLKKGKVFRKNGTKQITGYAYNTAVGHLKVLKKYLNLAAADKIPFENPFKNFVIPQYEPGHREVLNKDEVALLFSFRKSAKLTTHELDVLDRYLVGCFTGLRKSDIEALIPKKHISNGRLLMKPGKTMNFGTQVEFKLPAPALIILKDYAKSGFDFMHDSLLNKTLKKVMAVVGITKYIKFHSSRDCFAVLYLKFGGNLGDLKDIMGHKKISTTEIYLKMGSDAKNDTMEMFDQVI